MFHAEGSHVAYIGTGEPDAPIVSGDEGCVILAAENGSYVQWVSGACREDISLVSNAELQEIKRATANLDEFLEVPLQAVAARDIFDKSGASGLLNALNKEGRLGFFEGIAQQIATSVLVAIRDEPSFRTILGQLSPSEAQDVLDLSTTALLKDAFGGEIDE